jgi:hypothetical protein
MLPDMSTGGSEPNLSERGLLQTWGVTAHFKLAALNDSYQPRNPDLYFIGKRRKQYGLFDRSNVWSGYFYPHENVDLSGFKVGKLSVLLHSVSEAFDEAERRERLQHYHRMVANRGIDDFDLYTANSTTVFDKIMSSAERAAQVRLHDSDETPIEHECSKTFRSAMGAGHECDYFNVLGLVRPPGSIGFEVCGTGWLFRHAVAHSLGPGSCWTRVILV